MSQPQHSATIDLEGLDALPLFGQADENLRAIERHYGFPLLMRSGRRLVLTQPARRVVDYARRILRLVGESDPSPHWNSRGHFFAAAAEAMRRILVERARRKAAVIHGGGLQRIDLNHVDVAAETDSDVLLLVDEALTALAERNSTAAQLIKLRFFLGLPNAQAAEMLGVPERTATRVWAYARSWLYREIEKKR